MSQDEIPSDPPADETERAIWTIRRLVKATTGKVLSEEEAKSLFAQAKAKMASALSEVTPN
jgi:hypothetical protein